MAEFDTQLAVWGQRLQVLDQQISSMQLTISESLTQLRGHLNSLVVSADEWIAHAEKDPSTPSELLSKVQALKAKVMTLGQVTSDTDTQSLVVISEELRELSVAILSNLTSQATVFAAALDQAALELSTHYGIQI